MKKILTNVVLLFYAFTGFCQTADTIYTNNSKIACSVKEITPDAVKFSYVGEDLVNSVYKNTIQKIVFKSGRVQTFAEATSYKTVNTADDYDNVTLTEVQSEVNGLYKLGDVSSKAKGTTTLSNMERVKERAIKKMKIQAAMMRADIVYLTQNTTTGNQSGTAFQAGKATETNLEGVAYSNKIPSYDDFVKLVGGKNQFQTFEEQKLSGSDADIVKSSYAKQIAVNKVYSEDGLIMMDATIPGVDNKSFRVVSFSNDEFVLFYQIRETVINVIVKI